MISLPYHFTGQNGKIDMSFFTPDCFHFTMKGHEELAKGLWNNMVNDIDFFNLKKTLLKAVFNRFHHTDARCAA